MPDPLPIVTTGWGEDSHCIEEGVRVVTRPGHLPQLPSHCERMSRILRSPPLHRSRAK